MKTVCRMVLFTILLLLVGSCEKVPERHIDIAHNSWPGYEPLSLAQEERFYGGVQVLVHRAANATDIIKALEHDVVDIAAVTLDEALLLQAKVNEPLVVIAVLDISDGGDALLAGPGIDSLDALKGKRIGVESSALGAFMLSRAMDFSDQNGSRGLQIVPMTHDRHFEAFTRGEVDAVVTFEPVKSQLLRTDAHVLFDSSMIPGEIIDVLVAKARVAREKEREVKAVLQGYFDALDAIGREPDAMNKKMSAYEQVDTDLFLLCKSGLRTPGLKENRTLLSSSDTTLPHAIDHIKAVIFEHDTAEYDKVGLLITDTYLPSERDE